MNNEYPLEYLNPSLLVDYPLNAKKHDESQIDKLAKEIEAVGFRVPIVVDHLGVIVSGHGRKAAAIKAGLGSVPVHRLPADISPERVRAMRLFDNKIAESGMDEKLLRQELSELVSLDGFDFSWTGFAESEIVNVLPEDNDWVKERGERNAEEDERADAVPELVEQNPRGVVRGQVWKLGRHRLMCGDSTSQDDVSTLMDGQKAQMVFTDPPYGINLNGDVSSVFSREKNARKWEQIKNDDVFFDVQPILSIFDYCKEIFVWGANFLGLVGNYVVWDKVCQKYDGRPCVSDFELCWTKQKHQQKIVYMEWVGWSGRGEGDGNRVHPTQKPVGLPVWFFDRWGKDCERVVDLFGGSGSTLIACEKTGRTCFMMELDEHYVSVIIERWEKFTGQKAELLTSP